MNQSNPSPKAPARESKSSTITMAVVGLASLALFGWMAWEFYLAAGSMIWPSTEGTVQSLKVWEEKPLSGGKSNFQIEIRYDYMVNGKNYTGERFNSRNNHVDESEIASIRRQYAVGAKCQVLYSRLMPSHSILTRGITVSAWGKLVIGLVALAAAAFFLYFAFKKEKASPGEPADETGAA